MSDLLSEPRISLNALAAREDVHPSTCWRWCLSGIEGHRLESFLVGRKRYTTIPAFERWVAKINGAHPESRETPRQRDGSIDAAEQELDELLGPADESDEEGNDGRE